MVHERNDEKLHFDFWTNFVMPNFNYAIPISVGKESCLMNAVLKCLRDSPDSKLFFCSNKIVQDATQFYRSRDANQPIKYQTEDYEKAYARNFFIAIENLVSCQTLERFEETLKVFQGAWPTGYQTFFSEKLSPLIKNNLARTKASNMKPDAPEQTRYELDCDLADGDRFCLTDLIMRLYQRSCELLIEFNQLYGSSKPYKVNYKFISLLKDMPIESKFIGYLDETKKKNKQSCLKLFEPSIYSLFHFQIADLVINNELIHFDAPTCSYKVRSPFNESAEKVYDDQGKTRCTCSLPAVCFHKIAAKFVSES